ncbi:MAG: TonB-dependent receptor [Massilibacteroides sp.]|nr:TonB-dependent receptor [Massilibacteroides sp.]MDD4115605.1 TonB-dependent receptor [Massilibacteroides sp.]
MLSEIVDEGNSNLERIQNQTQKGKIITGNVLDDTGMPIIGASVLIKGTTNGTVSDIDGNFSIAVDKTEAVLQVSYIGYLKQEISIKGNQPLQIVLSTDSQNLDEIVVVGYQTMRKTDVTSAIASIKAKELNLTTPSIGQSLVGKVAGVQISQVSGAPYNSTKIRVRGTVSVNSSSDPLYVIDGYPSNEDLFLNPEDIESIEVLKDAASAAIYGSRAAGGVILITTKRGKEGKAKVDYGYQFSINQLSKKVDMLNAQEFTELHVEGHNTAYKNLLLSKGIEWNDQMFSDTNEKRKERLGSYNSAAMVPEFMYDFANQKVISPQYDTDWQDELYRNASGHRHTISINGGSKGIRYNVSANYQLLDGIILSTKQDRLNLRSNIDIDVSSRFKISANFATTYTWSREVREGRFNQGPILGALVYAPIFRAYDDDGKIIKNEMASYAADHAFQSIENPVALATETKISRNKTHNTYNINGSYELIKDFFINANLGMFNSAEKYEFYLPTSLSSGNNPPYSDAAKAAAYALAKNTNQQNYLGEFTTNYAKKWDVHSLQGVAGFSLQKDKLDILEVKGTGYEDDHIQEVTGHGADPADISLTSNTAKSNWSMVSYFARLNYNYNDLYFFTASFRGDGSSLFGPLNRWGYFPSVSGGWAISNEKFFQEKVGESTSLKLRASWGLSGNNNIGNYKYAQVMSSPTGTVIGGSVVSSMYSGGFMDPALGWETTSQMNIGFDLGLFKHRLDLSVNFYNSLTKDLLFNQTITASSGSTSYLTNLPNSKIRNRGLDLQADVRVIAKKDFDLNFSGNISFNRNKILDLGGASTIITNGAERSYKTHITQEGSPIGMFYGFKVKGMVREADMTNIEMDNQYYNSASQSFPDGYNLKGPARSTSQTTPLAPGDLYFEDLNGDGVVNDDDKQIIGSPHPDFTFGFNVNGNLRSFDFTASFNGSYGNDVLDGQDYYIFNMEGSGNQYKEVVQRYRNEENPGNGKIYRASRGGTQSNSTRLSTFYLQDGSFLRCTNITIGYSIPHIAKLTNGNVSNLRVYAAVDNAFTISAYKGYNPEVDYNDGANLTPGVDYGKYPLVRAYNLGVQLSF